MGTGKGSDADKGTGQNSGLDDAEIQFRAERRTAITAYGADQEFRQVSDDWLRLSMDRRYVYNFEWAGRPIIQYPQELAALHEVIWQTRPDVIIETGIAHGGSLVFSASQLLMLDTLDAMERGEMFDPRAPGRHVIGVDIDIRKHNLRAIKAHPLAPRIQMIEGSSVDPAIVAQVKALVDTGARVMVCLDSNHTQDHVMQELDAYAPLVTPGCFCVVFDTFIETLPQGFIQDRPWDVGNNPYTAIDAWLPKNPAFERLAEMSDKLMITAMPGGFLRRKT